MAYSTPSAGIMCLYLEKWKSSISAN